MSRRHPLAIIAALWLALVLALVAGVCTFKPAPVVPEAPAPTVTRVPMTVLPTLTPTAQSAELLPPKPSKTPQPPIVLDALPMVTSTAVPPTETPTPTATPTVVPTPDRPPLQRG
jgi:hypothetical protein